MTTRDDYLIMETYSKAKASTPTRYYFWIEHFRYMSENPVRSKYGVIQEDCFQQAYGRTWKQLLDLATKNPLKYKVYHLINGVDVICISHNIMGSGTDITPICEVYKEIMGGREVSEVAEHLKNRKAIEDKYGDELEDI